MESDDGTGAAAHHGAAEPESGDPGRDEQELLAAFDRLAPQGSLRWAFDDAMRRLSAPAPGAEGAGSVPWGGLPADLWDRGRSARIGRRFVGDVAGVLAGVLAADARAVAAAAADASVGDRLVAAWDALRFLAARVDELERRASAVGPSAGAPGPLPPSPDLSVWTDRVASWFGGADRAVTGARGADGAGPGERPTVLVGESGDGVLVDALAGAGLRVRGVEPRAEVAWRSLEGPAGPTGPRQVVLGETADVLRATGSGSLAGVVLAGCVDRVDLSTKVALLEDAVRSTARGGAVALLVTDPEAWDAGLDTVEADLTPGRPLHPETWLHLLRRSGVGGVTWLRPGAGPVHALVGTVGS